MRTPIIPDPPAGPSRDRLWTESDLETFFGFRSVDELISRHADFPSPVPLLMQGRRWRPSDVIAWTNSLVSRPKRVTRRSAIPDFDISSLAE